MFENYLVQVLYYVEEVSDQLTYLVSSWMKITDTIQQMTCIVLICQSW